MGKSSQRISISTRENESNRKHVVILCKEASRRHRPERSINRKTDTQYTPKGDICGTLQKSKTVFVIENETYQDSWSHDL